MKALVKLSDLFPNFLKTLKTKLRKETHKINIFLSLSLSKEKLLLTKYLV